ncbi:MAG: 2Fe-2S iron-sulfur cluster binding domain-containing protein [Gammaproteobacteria bacterium]|nr:2Fe-2S iron-sulfur cluster binding domain-containing protein [Gammaproteobacteria bacterium]
MGKLTLLERRLRIVTGLILAVYIFTHLFNHSLGLLSLEAMETMRKLVTPLWRSWFGGLLIYGSLLTHFAMALMSLYRRSSLRMPGWELAQLMLGLAIIPLLAGHVAATWGSRVLMGYDPNYDFALNAILSSPWLSSKQLVLVIVAWIHVVIGLHFFLRLFKTYRRMAVHLYPIVILTPLLVLFSLIRVGFELGVWTSKSAEPGKSSINSYLGAEPSYLEGTPINVLFHHGVLTTFFLLLAFTLIARLIRVRYQQTHGNVVIRHLNGRELKGSPGQTILEIMRMHSIPHTSLCGGRGRCTTCRVRVGTGASQLHKPSKLEQFALNRIGAAPNVRLACQTRPLHPLQISPLVPADLGIENSLRKGGVSGDEREVVAMFVDLRGSSSISERHLPYDVLFILNQFFLEMTDALVDSEGHYAQFEGDGLLALYGLKRGMKTGCVDALRGAMDMQNRMNQLNEKLSGELEQPLKFGIGIHCGQAIVGTMGPPSSPNLSAIGDCINAAARLESMSKEFSCVLMVSDDVIKQTELDFESFDSQVVSLRGKQQSVLVYALKNPLDIPLIENYPG